MDVYMSTVYRNHYHKWGSLIEFIFLTVMITNRAFYTSSKILLNISNVTALKYFSSVCILSSYPLY